MALVLMTVTIEGETEYDDVREVRLSVQIKYECRLQQWDGTEALDLCV